MSRTMVIVGVLCAGCPAGGDDHDVDGGVDTTGLTITWASAPPVPGPVAADRTVRDLHIRYTSVQLISDAAPADDRTSTGAITLDWDEHGAPPALAFPEAPPGIYSGLTLGADGGYERLRIDGTVDLGGAWRELEIELDANLPTPVSFTLDVRPGEPAILPIELDVAAVLAAVRFDELPVDGEGHLELHTGDPQAPAVMAALRAAVHVAAKPES